MLAALQTGGNPNQAIYGLSDGACGFGEIPRTSWPFWQVAALGFGNPISASNLPQKWGCGACVEVTCEGPVRPSCLCALSILMSLLALTAEGVLGQHKYGSGQADQPGTPWINRPGNSRASLVVKGKLQQLLEDTTNSAHCIPMSSWH